MSDQAVTALNLEAPSLALKIDEHKLDIRAQEAVQQDISEDRLFIHGINVPKLKKYYRKWKRNISIAVFGTQFLLAWTLWFIFAETCNLWGATFMESLSWSLLKSISSTGGTSAQVSISVGFAVFLGGVVKNLFRLMAQRKRIMWECDLCKSGRYPTYMTPAITSKIMSLFGWRLNGFWLGFTIVGLGCVSCVYSYLYRGFGESQWKVDFSEMWKNLFTRWGVKEGSKVFKYSCCVILGGCLILAVTNLFSRIAIGNVFKIFDTNELSMHPELREKVFKLNKRDKIWSTVILCVIGLGLFIILKRLVIAVFNRSFNQSKW